MAELVAFYSRADENYFGGTYRYIEVGNTENEAKMIAAATGAELFKKRRMMKLWPALLPRSCWTWRSSSLRIFGTPFTPIRWQSGAMRSGS